MAASTFASASPTTTNFPNGINAGDIINSGAIYVQGNVATGITAHAGGGQGSAVLLTAAVNRIDTVATAADSVALPAPSYVGQQVVIINNAAANSVQVFGSGTDTINGVATATGVAQAAGKTAIYQAVTIGTGAAWFRLLSA